MARRYISLIAADPARRVVGGPNVLVSFYNGRTNVLATAYLALTGADLVTLPMRANPGTEHFVRIQPAVGDTTIQVDSTAGWLAGDVVRFRSGSTQTERAIKTIVSATAIDLDAAIGTAFIVGTAIRGQVGHARVAIDDTSDYSADVQNVNEGWKSVRIDFFTLQTAATIAFFEDAVSVSARSTLNVQGIGLKATDDAGNNRVNLSYWRHDLWVAGVL